MTDSDWRAEPHDIAAEQATLGAMLTSPAVAVRLRRTLVAGDFYRPGHQVIWDALVAVVDDLGAADPVVVLTRLQQDGTAKLINGGVYLHTLIAACPLASNGPVYAATVRRHAVTRRLRAAAHQVLHSTEGDDAPDPSALTERAIRALEDVRADGGAEHTVQRIDHFLDAEDDAYDWVIEGLLERGDRLMLTGVEGAGKSELIRQLACCAAAGVHPFNHLRNVTPARALIIDCENSARLMRRKLRPMLEKTASRQRPVDPDLLWLESRSAGLDLTTDRDASWLLQQVAHVKPDITCIGPLYKLNPRAIKDDTDAAPILAVFDAIRARGTCLVIECHAGHAIGAGGRRDMRPRGSSALLGYPEFGYGLRWSDDDGEAYGADRIVDFVSWRGDRDERKWPEKLMSGGIWPWSECV